MSCLDGGPDEHATSLLVLRERSTHRHEEAALVLLQALLEPGGSHLPDGLLQLRESRDACSWLQVVGREGRLESFPREEGAFRKPEEREHGARLALLRDAVMQVRTEAANLVVPQASKRDELASCLGQQLQMAVQGLPLHIREHLRQTGVCSGGEGCQQRGELQRRDGRLLQALLRTLVARLDELHDLLQAELEDGPVLLQLASDQCVDALLEGLVDLLDAMRIGLLPGLVAIRQNCSQLNSHRSTRESSPSEHTHHATTRRPDCLGPRLQIGLQLPQVTLATFALQDAVEGLGRCSGARYEARERCDRLQRDELLAHAQGVGEGNLCKQTSIHNQRYWTGEGRSSSIRSALHGHHRKHDHQRHFVIITVITVITIITVITVHRHNRHNRRR